MRIVSLTVGLVLLLSLSCGCLSTGTSPYLRKLKPSERIAPRQYGEDVRNGTRAAIVAFNSEVVSGKRPRVRTLVTEENAGRLLDRITPEQLREMTDAMLSTFVTEMAGVPDLTIIPLSEVAANPLYRRLSFPQGTEIQGFSLTRGNGRRVAPNGLRYIDVPQSEMSRDLGLLNLGRRFDNFNKQFEDDFSQMAAAIGVDFIIFVNNRVELSAEFNEGWGGELKLMEVAIIGRNSRRKFAFAQYASGSFSDETFSMTTDPVPQGTLRLIEVSESRNLKEAEFSKNRFWKTMAGPYKGLSQAFAERLRNIRN